MRRNGKIARLPATVRAELNLRMEKGDEGPGLLDWLNGLPEVQESLKDGFEGASITKQNLSEWRQGGFREWELRQEWISQASELEDSADEMGEAVDTASLPGALAGLLAARYAALLNAWDGEPDPKFEEKLRLLRVLNRDVALLQRTLHRADKRERELEQEAEEREQREFEERKKRTLGRLWSVPEGAALAETLGNGERGRKLAEMIMAVENDLPLPEAKEEGTRKKEEKGRHRGQARRGGPRQSDPVQPSPTSDSEHAEADLAASGQAEGLANGD